MTLALFNGCSPLIQCPRYSEPRTWPISLRRTIELGRFRRPQWSPLLERRAKLFFSADGTKSWLFHITTLTRFNNVVILIRYGRKSSLLKCGCFFQAIFYCNCVYLQIYNPRYCMQLDSPQVQCCNNAARKARQISFAALLNVFHSLPISWKDLSDTHDTLE